MNSILNNKNFEGLKDIYIVCTNVQQEKSVLETIESCNEGFTWSFEERPTKFKSSKLKDCCDFSYVSRYIICIGLKTKRLSYIVDNEYLHKLGNITRITQKDFAVYKQIDFVLLAKIKDILDDKEKEYLSAVIRPFKSRVLSFSKLFQCVHEFKCEIIKIKVQGGVDTHITETIYLPYFEKESMYKNMILNKEYTLKELDLD